MNIKKNYAFIILIVLMNNWNFKTNAQVVINEFSCSNLSQFVDNHSDYGDWFELYNGSLSPVNLTGYYLSDDSTDNMKWQIPSGITIAGNGFLRFWASGRNEVSGTSYHTNFKLTQTKKNKEELTLSDPSGVIVDQIKITEKTQLGHSYGRGNDGLSSWRVFTNPTINASNNTATSYIGYAPKPDFSLVAGFYTATQSVTITCTDPSAVIRYTTDGSKPLATSAIYTSPINIAATTVLQAVAFSTNPQILPSFIEFNTYFINVSHTIPIVSICGTNLTQLANGSGSLEPLGGFEYFDTLHVRKARTYGEFNRHGQDSWANSHRSLDFISRDEMGYNAVIKEPLFKMSTRDEFQRVILRAAGDDNYPADFSPSNAGSAHMRDAYVENLAKSGGLDLDVREGAKCIIYLNGAYWGVYDLRENPDDHDYTDFHYGQDKFHLQYIKTWGNTWAQYGGQQALNDWTAFHNFIMTNNMADSTNYKYVTDRMEVQSLMDYVIVNTFTVCTDWLNYNTGWWRGMDSTGTHLKWSYILWDNDAVFDFYINYTGVPSTAFNAPPCGVLNSTSVSDPKGHIAMLNKLRTNPECNQQFISREIDLWNTVFSCDYMLAHLDSTKAVIDPEMAGQAARWGGTYSGWLANFNTMRDFISQRCSYLSTGLASCFSLTGPYDIVVTADPVNAGAIKFNTLTLTQLPWTGHYFGGVDTKIEAVPNANYTFTNWSTTSQTLSPNNAAVAAKFNLTGADTLVAHFTFNPTGIQQLIGNSPELNAAPTVFNNETTIQYALPAAMNVSLKIYNVLGNEALNVIQSDNSNQQGNYAVSVNFTNAGLPSGIYFAELIAGGYKKTIKLLYTHQ